MKKIIILNTSPKGTKASSQKLLNELEAKIEEIQIEYKLESFSYASIFKNEKKSNQLFTAILESDVLILAFPLYVDSLSAVTQDFVERYNQFTIERKRENPQELYTIINCGFPEPEHNTIAFEIIQNFAAETGFNCQYNLSIGMGSMAGQVPIKSRPMKNIERHFDAIIEHLRKPVVSTDFNRKIEYSSPTFGFLNFFSKSLYTMFGFHGWKQQAKKNKVKHLLYAKPYQKES